MPAISCTRRQLITLHFAILRFRRNTASVYQVTRLGHEHCDITEGELLDITPLVVDGKKLVTLYDKDLTEGINLLIGELIEESLRDEQLSLSLSSCELMN
jgi:hypothetical protein